jgi:hypothetical protein
MGGGRTARNSSILERTREYLYHSSMNRIRLNYLLKRVGAVVINNVPDDSKGYIDLSPTNLSKTSLIDLLNGKV